MELADWMDLVMAMTKRIETPVPPRKMKRSG